MAFEMGKLLEFFVESQGSDMILTVGSPPSIRISGSLKPIAKAPLTPEDCRSLVREFVPEKNREELEELGSTDFSMKYGTKATFRGNAFRQQGNMAMVLRMIPTEIFDFDRLGLPKITLDQISRPRGLFLVTGPTGSGKSTTLASLVNHINVNEAKHILTVEDPIEFYHKSQKSIVNQRMVGEDAPTFSEALRRALRQDPDVILVGEMRDLDTIQTALRAAETGHLVMSTLHTRSASETVTRIVDAFPSGQQDMVRTMLASSLNMVISQTLVKKAGGGRVCASEVMVVSHGMRQMIRDNRVHQIPSAIETNTGEGNRLLDQHLCDLYLKGDIRWEDAVDKSADPTSIKARLTELRSSVQYWMTQIELGNLKPTEALAKCPDQNGLKLALKAKREGKG